MEDGAGTTVPRKRSAAATRESILAAATRRFASQGYERSGVREIAGDAGVTAALVNRYFASKEGLYAQVIDRSFDVGDLFDGPRADLPRRIARRAVYGHGEQGQTTLLLLLRSATEPHAAVLLKSKINQNFIQPLAQKLGGSHAEARAALIAAQLTGFATLDELIHVDVLTTADREGLVNMLVEMLQTCVGEEE
ncbi:TetR family transcriptional regulator [Isosphaeraceae bacterium EP7]